MAALDNNKYKILLVDDDYLNQRMMGLLLSNEGFLFDIASNGVEAVNAVQSQHFDLVLMDLQMPILDGYEATRRIRAWEAGNGHLPVVALTAMLFEKSDIQLCLDAGMDDWISKPFNTTELFQVINSHVGKASKHTATQNVQGMEFEDGNSLINIQAALPRFGNDIQTYQEFLDEFIQTLPDKMKRFRVMFDSGDYKSLSANAHNLKGVSASLGAMQLSVSASKLDKQSRDGEASRIEEILDECDKITLALQKNAMKLTTKYPHNKGRIE